MNIFDLVWSRFYLYDERHDIGFPLYGASVSMTFFMLLYIGGIVWFPSAIGIYELPDLPFVPYTIGCILIIVFFILRNKDKLTREKRLSAYQKYKGIYPRKEKIRFLLFIITPIILCIIDFVTTNIRYNVLHG